MFRKDRLFTFIAICIVVLVVVACSAQSQPEGAAGSPTTGEQVTPGDGDSEVIEAHAEGDGHDANAGGDGHADAAPIAAEAMHMEGDSHAPAAHMEADEHGEAGDHAEGEEHGVPAEAMAVENPVPSTDDSIAAGAATYTQYCAVCHGNEGKGDGPGAAGLNPKPADFSAEHVQVLSDGGLFWFITNGVPNSVMPPWGGVLSEEQRWEIVNFLRTFDLQ